MAETAGPFQSVYYIGWVRILSWEKAVEKKIFPLINKMEGMIYLYLNPRSDIQLLL